MNKQQPDPAIRAMLSSLRMIYFGLMIPIAVLSAVLYYLIEAGEMGPPDYSLAPTLQTIAIVLVPLSLAAAYFYFKSGLSKIDQNLSLADKLRKYQLLILIRSAILEMGFFFCLIAATLTRVSLFLTAAPIILFIFLLLRPSGSAIILDLSITGREKEQVEGYQ